MFYVIKQETIKTEYNRNERFQKYGCLPYGRSRHVVTYIYDYDSTQRKRLHYVTLI